MEEWLEEMYLLSTLRESWDSGGWRGARVEAFGVRWLLGSPTTIWVLVDASPTDPTSNGQPNVEDLNGGQYGGGA
jgi:hypothetical protein